MEYTSNLYAKTDAKTDENYSNYVITIENFGSSLICSLDYAGKKWESKITQDDLKSGVVSLIKLQNILKSYQTIRQNSQCQFKFEQINNQRTGIKHMILHIVYSDDFIDWEEKIYFREKCQIEDDIQENLLLKQLVQTQQNKIGRLENIIEKMEKRLDVLEKDSLINFSYYSNTGTSISKLLPKKINNLTVCFGGHSTSLSFNGCDAFLKNKQYLHLYNYSEVNKHLYRETSSYNTCIQEFDFNEISIKSNDPITKFIDEYLSFKQNYFHVSVIKICGFHCLKLYSDVLIKHTNYKKVIFPFNKEFDDSELKSHCAANNIEYTYV